MLAVKFVLATGYGTIRLMFKMAQLEEYCYRVESYDIGLPCLVQFRSSYYTWFDTSLTTEHIAVAESRQLWNYLFHINFITLICFAM